MFLSFLTVRYIYGSKRNIFHFTIILRLCIIEVDDIFRGEMSEDISEVMSGAIAFSFDFEYRDANLIGVNLSKYCSNTWTTEIDLFFAGKKEMLCFIYLDSSIVLEPFGNFFLETFVVFESLFISGEKFVAFFDTSFFQIRNFSDFRDKKSSCFLKMRPTSCNLFYSIKLPVFFFSCNAGIESLKLYGL